MNIRLDWIADIFNYILIVFFWIGSKQEFSSFLFVWECPVPLLQARAIDILVSFPANMGCEIDKNMDFMEEEPGGTGQIWGSGAAPTYIEQLQTRATHLRIGDWGMPRLCS